MTASDHIGGPMLCPYCGEAYNFNAAHLCRQFIPTASDHLKQRLATGSLGGDQDEKAVEELIAENERLAQKVQDKMLRGANWLNTIQGFAVNNYAPAMQFFRDMNAAQTVEPPSMRKLFIVSWDHPLGANMQIEELNEDPRAALAQKTRECEQAAWEKCCTDIKQRLKNEVEQLQVQLAGCLTAAEGWGLDQPAKQGDYGWSLAYQKTLELRAQVEQLQKQVAEMDRKNIELLNDASVWRNRAINAEEELAGTNRLASRARTK